MTADELVAEGHRLHNLGHPLVFLHPSQEWMAIELQAPFLRYERMTDSPSQPVSPLLRRLETAQKDCMDDGQVAAAILLQDAREAIIDCENHKTERRYPQ